MKIVLFIFAFVLVGTLGVIPAYDSHMAYADDAPRISKQNVLIELQSIELDKNKDQKKLLSSISTLEKILNDKFWQDDSHLTMIGKKMFNHEKKIIKDLGKIKSYDFSSIILILVDSDGALAQNQINLLSTDSDVKKLDKKIKKANKEMTKAQKDLEKNKLSKAIDHYKKAWKLAKMGEGIDVPDSESDFIDIDPMDGLPDYYVKIISSDNLKKPFEIKYNIQNECVDLGPKDPMDVGGDTFDDASMLIGVSTVDQEWLTDDVKVWNKWFKNNDENKVVDLVYWDSRHLPNYDLLSGDDVIQGNSNGASFEQFTSLDELGGQSGWDGSLFFNAPPGDYLFWTIHPAGGYGYCDSLSGVGIHLTIP